MKKFLLSFLAFAFVFTYAEVSMADDYEDYYIYQNMNKVPPPPPMNTVPYYVMDDYDDYVEDYYKCMLGVDWDSVCMYWHDYARKKGIKIQSPYNAQYGAGAYPQAQPMQQAPIQQAPVQQAPVN